MLETPVLFLVFNRPELVQQVFSEIRKQQPRYLFVHADGPREDISDDIQKCAEVRRIIENQIDWECNLKTTFREYNLGCGKGPASAISWFFDNVSEGIIIEEDCLPHSDFFGYCSQLLERYRDDERIMIIGATTYHDDYPCIYSYTFTQYGTMAAWATWKRVWEKYDYTLAKFSREELKVRLKKQFYSRFEVRMWLGLYDWIVKDGFKSYWDWQLHFVVFYNGGFAIRPQKNMISNIGFGADATHTNYLSNSAFKANRQVYGGLPLHHPEEVIINRKIDSIYYKKMYRLPLIKRILNPLFRAFFSGEVGKTQLTQSFLEFYRRVKRTFKL